MSVILEVRRHGVAQPFPYENVKAAVDAALRHLESGEAWPVRISEGGVDIWKFNGIPPWADPEDNTIVDELVALLI